MAPCEKALIVDDSAGDRFLLANALRENGVSEVDFVSSGEQAVRYVSSLKIGSEPELIFIDLIMEKMSGLDLLRWLRQNSVFDHIPVIILTSSRDEEQKATAIALKAKAFFLKPMQLDELDAIVKKALAHCPQLQCA